MDRASRSTARRAAAGAAAASVLALAQFPPGGGLRLGLRPAAAQEALRPEVGKPLQAARDLVRQQRFKEALAKLRELDAVGNRSAAENFVIEQMRFSAATQAGDLEQASRAAQVVLAANRLSEADAARYSASLATLYYRARNYKEAAAWAERALKSNPNDAASRSLMTQAAFQSGDLATAGREAAAEVAAAEKAGRKPAEDKLQLLWNIAARTGGERGAALDALEKLVAYYPKKEYWVELLRRVEARPNFSPRLRLDLYRLQLATGTLETAPDLVEMAQLALQEGQATEARKVLADGFASGVLGKGAEAERQKRLLALAERKAGEASAQLAGVESQAAGDKDGAALVSAGLAYSAMGQGDKGVALIQQGIAKGGLKRPQDAQLHLGLALLRAGQRAKAVQALRAVSGTDGAADLARLWIRVPG